MASQEWKDFMSKRREYNAALESRNIEEIAKAKIALEDARKKHQATVGTASWPYSKPKGIPIQPARPEPKNR